MAVSVERCITIGYEGYANGIDCGEYSGNWLHSRELRIYMIAASYKPKKKFMQLAIAEAKRARDRGDYAIGAVITRLTGSREVVIASACVWARIGAVVYGVSQEDIAAYGCKRGTEDYKWRACLIPCRLVFEKGNHHIPVTGGFLRKECQKLFTYGTAHR